jgi:HD-GYP domain-containing protein (c-di-GMP phosphodiesterase class II)
MKRHPAGTREILKRTGCFSHLASVAASHHERLDGRGYNLGLAKNDLPLLSRVLCTSDICDALRASRPYRPGLPIERVLDIMRRDVGSWHRSDVFRSARNGARQARHRAARRCARARYVPSLAEDYGQAA